MQTREIPREQWVKFFDDFSKKHEGWIVTLEVMGSDIGDQQETNKLPLVGVSADVKAHENRIEIIVGGRPDADVRERHGPRDRIAHGCGGAPGTARVKPAINGRRRERARAGEDLVGAHVLHRRAVLMNG